MGVERLSNSKQFGRELKKNRLDRIYLFTGEEEGEKEKFIKKIVDMAFDNEEVKDYSVGRFHIENNEFNNAAEFALSSSIFSDKKVCLMQNINYLQSTGVDIGLFRELIDNLPESNILIMTTPENRVPPYISQELTKMMKIVQFWRYFENDIYTYITRTVRKYGLDIDRSAVILLVKLLGRDMKKIDSAIDKIISSGERLVTSEIVKTLIQEEKDTRVFDFIDALFMKKEEALISLGKLIENGIHELVILSLIFRQAEMIEKYHFLLKNGLSEEDAIVDVGIFPKKRRDFLEQTLRYPKESIMKIFPLIHRADFRIKRNTYSKSLIANPIFELVVDMLL